MKKRAIIALAKSLYEKTGVSFEKYQNEELANSIANLLMFPRYAISVFIRPIFFVFLTLLLAALIYLFIGATLFALALFILSLILSLTVGGMLGSTIFIAKVGNDVEKILTLSLEILQQILFDSKRVNFAKEIKQRVYPKLSEMINGVVLLVLLPTLQRVIKKKIPVVGGIVSAILGRIIMVWARRIQKKIQNENEKLEQTPDVITEDMPKTKMQEVWGRFCDANIKNIDYLKGGIGVTVGFATRIAAIPFQLLLVLNIGVAVFLLFFFYYILV